MQLDAVRISVPFKKTFTVSKGSATVKTNVLAVMNNRYNGEASGSIHAGPPVEEIERDLNKGLKLLAKVSEITIETMAEIQTWKINNTARSAITAMLLHFLSGESKRYPWELLSMATPVGIKSSFTIGIEDTESMIKSIKSCENPIIKIKMGHEDDVLILDSLDELVGKEIRVDANGGWSLEKAEEMIMHLSRKGVTVIEQPTTAEYFKEWQHIKGKNESVELIADEGLNSLDDYRQYADYIDGVNIKMEKCGGVLKGIEIARAAQEQNKKVMLGCMVESSIGISQSIYMSSVADYFDLDGPLLLEDDIADGIRYDRESIEVDREIIGGPKLKRNVIEKYIQE
ncbi:MAG: hypothetical protein IIC66_05465 [candidate division Zixibacteria bacterium]|nr:hypothetical protein [candidate division Zixibacteria bacterium]